MYDFIRTDEAAAQLKGLPILVVGDVMLDEYAFGTASRLTDEAPHPIFQNLNERAVTMLGGAGNVTMSLHQIGCIPDLMTVVGRDPWGDAIAGTLQRIGQVPFALSDYQTLTRRRYYALPSRSLMLRVDQGGPLPRPFTGRELFEQTTLERMAKCRAALVSDYGYGVMTPYFMQILIDHGRKLDIPVVIAAKRPRRKFIQGCDAMVLNAHEFMELAHAWGIAVPTGSSVSDAIPAGIEMREQLGARVLVVTLGEMGMIAVTADGVSELQPRFVKARSTVGAGDVFAATLTALLAIGKPPFGACGMAMEIASLSTQTDVTCVASPTALTDLKADVDKELKIQRHPAQLPTFIASLKTQGRRIGFTNGCFDHLHAGHLSTLRWARARCDVLIVGINDDGSVAELKGDTRPSQRLDDRMDALKMLDCVDVIVPFADRTPMALIELLKPDVLVKGADYEGRLVSGSETLHQWDGELLFAPYLEGYSTTALLDGEREIQDRSSHSPTDAHSSDQPTP